MGWPGPYEPGGLYHRVLAVSTANEPTFTQGSQNAAQAAALYGTSGMSLGMLTPIKAQVWYQGEPRTPSDAKHTSHDHLMPPSRLRQDSV